MRTFFTLALLEMYEKGRYENSSSWTEAATTSHSAPEAGGTKGPDCVTAAARLQREESDGPNQEAFAPSRFKHFSKCTIGLCPRKWWDAKKIGRFLSFSNRTHAQQFQWEQRRRQLMKSSPSSSFETGIAFCKSARASPRVGRLVIFKVVVFCFSPRGVACGRAARFS